MDLALDSMKLGLVNGFPFPIKFSIGVPRSKTNCPQAALGNSRDFNIDMAKLPSKYGTYDLEYVNCRTEKLTSRLDCPQAALGNSRDFNIDLAPKFIMASGKLVKMLVMTSVRVMHTRTQSNCYTLGSY